MSKLISNLLKISIPLLFIITLMLGYLYYPLLTLNGKAFIANAEETSTEVKDNGQPLAKYVDGYNFEKLQNQLYKNSEVVVSDYNPINPVLTFVQDAKSEQRQDINIYHLQRNIQNQKIYDIISYQVAKSNKYSFQDALTLVKQYDLTKNNPDPANITVFPAPSREEVERQKTIEMRDDPSNSAKFEQEFKNGIDSIKSARDKIANLKYGRKGVTIDIVEAKKEYQDFRDRISQAYTERTSNPTKIIKLYDLECNPNNNSKYLYWCDLLAMRREFVDNGFEGSVHDPLAL